MAIRVFITGGTFDKTYDEISGKLRFEDTHIHEMLLLGRSRLDLAVRTLMMVDTFVQALPHGVFVAMNGRSFPWDDVVKNRELGIFENRGRAT